MRPSRDQWAMELALITAKRSTCCRRSVGCVLLNERGQVLSTGYNGRAVGLPHCNEQVRASDDFPGVGVRIVETYPHACPGVSSPSGTNLDGCEAIHAEQNALLQCRDVYQISTCYTTTSPCMTCVKLLLNTSCHTIIYQDQYPHDQTAKLWERAGRVIKQLA